MLRNLLLISALLLAAGWVSAQPVLDARLVPHRTDSTHATKVYTAYQQNDYMAVEDSHPLMNVGLGANQTWNIDVEGDTAERVSSMFGFRFWSDTTCVPGPYRLYHIGTKRVFPGTGEVYAERVVKDVLFAPRADGLYVAGYQTQDGNTLSYSTPLPHIVYGMPLGGQHIDTAVNYVNGCRGMYYHSYRDTVSYAGYGRLSVNGGRAVQAILLRHRRMEYMPMNFGPPQPYALYTDFDWVDATNGTPLLGYEICNGISGAPQPAAHNLIYFIYFDGGYFPSRVASPTAVSPKLGTTAVSPNPVRHSLQVPGCRSAHVRIQGMAGSTILLPVHDGRIDVSSLPAGLYSLDMLTPGLTPQRFVKE